LKLITALGFEMIMVVAFDRVIYLLFNKHI